MKKYEVGFVRREWQYITLEAENENEARAKAFGRLNETNWDDYKSEPEVCNVNEV